MSLGLGTRRGVALFVMAAGLAVGAAVSSAGSVNAQTSITLTEPSAPLLPEKFGEWKKVASSGGAFGGTAEETPGYSLPMVNKEALAECGLQRSQVAEYTRGGRAVHIEAMQFGDRTGAYSAFTLMERPGMTVGNELGLNDAVGVSPDGGRAVLFTVGSSVVLANVGPARTAGGPARTAGDLKADVASLKALAEAMPKVWGNKAVAPLLPTLAPAKGLVAGSVRYALGPLSYAAEGGVLAANSLSWDKEPEAVTARYDDARGRETLTVLLYPTPTIAEAVAKTIQGELPQLDAQPDAQLGATPGGNAGTARMRREGALVLLASGSFAAEEAQRMVENIHLNEMTFNQDVQPPFHVVARQAASLLENIAILSGVLGAAAVLLGLFLGVGRATFRVLRGKPPAVEMEFLSLHLSPQNKPAQFHRPGSAEKGQGDF